MLQYTLARDSLLVGFGSVRACDVSPLTQRPENKAGARPSLFFAPTRDAHGLITRKTMSHLVLVRRRHVDGRSRAVVLRLPTNEWVSDQQFNSLLPQNMDIAVSVGRVVSSGLVAQADIAETVFEFESDQLETPVSLSIESFVFENRLREQLTVKNIPSEYQMFVVHWHQPEFHCSSFLQTTYAALSDGALVSYHAGHYFSVSVLQGGDALSPAFASCVQMQTGQSSTEEFANAFGRVLETLRQCGSGAPASLRTQLLSQWTRYQSEPIATGTSQGLMVWPVDSQRPFELTHTFARTLETALCPIASGYQRAREKVVQSDQEWLKALNHKRPSLDLPDFVRNLYERSLLTLKQMQDPAGGIIAAPEFQFEFTACGGYGYCWGRDAGFISLAMDTAGMYEESERFYSYMAKCQAENGSFLHRHDMAGNLGPSWGLLQPDETGSVLFGLWQHVKISGQTEGAAKLRTMVERGADWLASCRFEKTDWICEGFDLWEEREGVHLYSVAAAVAGLRAAADLAEKMRWQVKPEWRQRADQLSKLLEENLCVNGVQSDEPSFARTLFLKSHVASVPLACNAAVIAGLNPQRWSSDFVLDISLLGLFEPFNAVSKDMMDRTLPRLCHALRQSLWRSGVGGIGRYEGDHYRNGQPWILTTLWLALAAARCGEMSLASECCAWVLKHTPREGQLPEQVDPVSGEPAWVMPLTWSHAMFVLACCQLPKELWVSIVDSSTHSVH
jgi:GH15 family glucan-1,4-alpha-glucosidase